jgi:hypothetical protein
MYTDANAWPYALYTDPLFYLHHAWLDKLWWNWQSRDLSKRLAEIAGHTTRTRPAAGWIRATLNDTLNMFGVVRNAAIREVMDIRGDLLCVEYVENQEPNRTLALPVGKKRQAEGRWEGEEKEDEF